MLLVQTSFLVPFVFINLITCLCIENDKNKHHHNTYRDNVSNTLACIAFVVFDCDWFVFFYPLQSSSTVQLNCFAFYTSHSKDKFNVLP
jgi:hypothetical protein